MVVVLGVSAGASGARAILSHADQPHQRPIDQCVVARRPGADVGEAVAVAIDAMRAAAFERGELIAAVAITHRSDIQADAIRAALRSDRTPTVLVKESAAQLRYLRFTGRLPKFGTVVLYDLGSSGLTLTLADCASGTALRTRRSTVLGGDEYDAQVHRKLVSAGVDVDLPTSRRYKETLSAERIVTVEDPTSSQRTVLTRSDLAQLQMAGVQHSASFIRHLIEETGETPEAVVLLGGCTHNPLIADRLEATLNIPVIVENEPEEVSARGAVVLAGDRPTRVVRVARAIGAAAPEAKAASRRKLLSACAVAVVLVATITGVMLTKEDSGSAEQLPAPAPMEVAGVPTDPFE
ncbi:Hsp70 family protein [Antrihabitans spumae]|uniref:Hsp70 family protein n=1 Tax=Antrihabitans spumae TaxID=3373370 RepID=A0ABW7K5Z0_9NOCA